MATSRNPNTPWESNFREEMKRIRKLLGWSQTELATHVKDRGLPFHQQTVQRIEAGERPVRLDEAYVIAECLDVDLYTMTSSGSPDIRTLQYVVNMLERRADVLFSDFMDWDPDLEEAAEGVAFEVQRRLELNAGLADFPTAWAAAWLLKGQRAIEAKWQFLESLLDLRNDEEFRRLDEILVKSPSVTEFEWLSDNEHVAWSNLDLSDRPGELAKLNTAALLRRSTEFEDAKSDEAS
ncbi:Helix-turn-helix [Mycobacteroides abscessus subsp. abscessus]|nr:Helix-turn-helix [Mycobacteroides abscessus subsp. abscessus]